MSKPKKTAAEAWREFRDSIEPEIAAKRPPDVLVGIHSRQDPADEPAPPKKPKDL